MDLEYDSKFEEMKQYIPFLESMIKRLELTSSSSNPRQAQLDKIRSLRDLLLDKKKRMKMENLLKCEQVLVNLYTKVEQKDTLPGIQKVEESKSKEKSDLDSVRNKLKTVTKSIREDPDTLPEIARASETEVVCTPGSKEPALFQRRPHKASSPPKISSPKKSPQRPKPKGHFFTRVFTRVLKSPEPSDRRWSSSQSSSEKPLFSRRSPRRSPRRYSPPHHKKDRKKFSKPNKSKDLNITLNVPEESLNSLNTEDILSRIINCRDGDVDIDTLRDLRTQILGELKQTGANDDISDLILKSYKKKKRSKQKKKEVEEGELSDSESEAIDSIYGSLIVVEKDKGASKQAKTSSEKEEQPRKIQICLVINSDKDSSKVDDEKPKDISGIDFEMFDDIEKPLKHEVTEKPKEKVCLEKQVDSKQEKSQSVKNQSKLQEVITIDDDEELKVTKPSTPIETVTKHIKSSCIDISGDSSTKKEEAKPLPYKPNFYKPLIEENLENPEIRTEISMIDKSRVQAKTVNDKFQVETETVTNKSQFETETVTNKSHFKSDTVIDKSQVETPTTSELSKESFDIPDTKNPPELETIKKLTYDPEKSSKNLEVPVAKKDEEIMTDRAKSPAVEIPLLNEPPIPAPPPKKDVVSEIDILQALKNEILSENITIPGSDTVTPALHQPKLTKVSSAQEIMNKKRISIEKYKQNSVTSSKPLFIKKPKSYMSKEDYAKKQSLKLTEKECERFNFPAKLALDESSDEDIAEEYSLDDIYRGLAPESPENDDFADTGNLSPIIIPADPVKTLAATTKSDIDMRTIPLVSPAVAKLSANNKPMSPSVSNETSAIRNEKIPEQKKRSLLVDPRVRRENRTINLESPNPHVMNPDRTPRSTNFPNMTPNARTFELTPSRQLVDSDDSSSRKHVYAPMISCYDPREHRQQCENRDGHSKQLQRPHWESNIDMNNEGRRSRWETDNRDGNHSRNWDERHSRSSDSRNWDDRNIRNSEYQKSRYNESDKYQRGSRNDRYIHDRRDDFSYKRQDCPPTPSNSFGRSDCPATPTPSFGRLEAPMTPVHAFGRSECPTTPSHPFGRTECPLTPSHPFGRSECPTTPSHPFGQTECPRTPSHPFGKSDIGMAPMAQSNAFGRPEYPQNTMNNAPKYVKDPRLNRTDSSDSNSHNFNDDRDRVYYKDRKQSDGHDMHYNASDFQRGYSRDHSDGRDRNRPYEQNGRSYNRDQSHYEPNIGRGNKDLETNKLFTRERCRRDDYRTESDYVRNTDEVASTRNFQRAHSVGRTIPTKETFVPSSARQGRNSKDEINYVNKLSVKPQTGSSFIIDTSVDKTFQEFLNGKGLQVFDYSFDARKQRASSVGRSLIRESSVGPNVRETSVSRTVPEPSIFDNSSLMRKDFVRARSMGRDMVNEKTERSLKDLKADFKNYSDSYKEKETNRLMKSKEQSQASKKMNYLDHRSRKIAKEKEMHEKSNVISKPAYSPRKNSRDPRMSRDQFESKSRYKIDRRKQHGIVYSNDNIAKGTILGSGYGVKNYKIPKIKRVEPVVKPDITEKIATDKVKEIAVRGTEKKTKEVSNKPKVIEKKDKVGVKEKDEKESNNTKSKFAVDDTIKRTRSSKSGTSETKLFDDDSVTKRKTRKSVIYDSDSDSEIVSKEKKDLDIKISNKTESPKQRASLCKAKKAESKDEALDSSFGMDDLEIFPENMASDPVMANINALIADLDNDIDTSKPEESNSEFTNEINLEKILNSFSSPDRSQDFVTDVSLKDITEFITEDLNRSDTQSPEQNKENSTDTKLEDRIVKDKHDIQTNVAVPKSHSDDPKSTENDMVLPNTTDSKVSPTVEFDQIGKDAEIPDKEMNIAKSAMENEAIDSTTENDMEMTKKAIEKSQEDSNTECSSTPDSTIHTEMQSSNEEKGLPDSTNEVQNEMHSDITSTHVSAESLNKDAAEPLSIKQEINKLDSISNLFSMLKDKSKIKELLSMLDDQSSDNEKIKKKLEKLSEIVSDDEETDDVVVQEKKVASDLQEKDNTEEGKSLQVNSTASDDKKETFNESHISEDKMAAEDDKTEAINQNEEGSETAEMSKLEDEAEMEETDDASALKIKKPRKRRGRKGKWKASKKVVRVTRQAANTPKKPKITRELKQLQDDIKEMFISNDVINSTGIRMCRLAKLIDEKSTNQDEENVSLPKEIKPIVVLEKFKEKCAVENALLTVKMTKIKPMPKSKVKVSSNDTTEIDHKREKSKPAPKYKPGPKSKTKLQQQGPDPYLFDPDSVSETNTSKDTDNELQNSSESDNDSLSSSKSFGSSEVLAELKKKPKRKRNSWQAGVIKQQKRKKKAIAKPAYASIEDDEPNPKNDNEEEDEKVHTEITIPDFNCFTDKNYCFSKGVTIYPCRLCPYGGTDIVNHYKRNHPHSEIPLSRMSPKVAQEAINQSEDVNFQAISLLRTEKHVCRFCFKEFSGKGRANTNKLEEFFWHVVSTHTGEYKQLCSECINVTKCPFNLDIPPPPKEVKGQLLGYICGRCNFSQISLENLKTHVIVRHNNVHTTVYTINFAVMTKKTIEALMKRCESMENVEQPRVLRSGRSNQSLTDVSDTRSEITESTDLNSDLESVKRQFKKDEVKPASKITLENDNIIREKPNAEDEAAKVKAEANEKEDDNQYFVDRSDIHDTSEPETEGYQRPVSDDIFDCAHFKVCYTNSGTKEYVCCVNGKENHYKTSLLISMKKHVQHKHSEKWDGYCYVCKLIVTPQGDHRFKECFQHYLDKHIDNFPIMRPIVEPTITPESVPESSTATPIERASPKPYINVRPMADLIAQDSVPTEQPEEIPVALPVIESVVSLGTATTPQVASPGPSSIYSEPSCSYEPVQTPVQIPQKTFKYEEAQAEVMSKKLRAVLDSMLSIDKLIRIFKCAGRYCSFTSDSAENAILHASTHQRIGGENALICAYCDFDCAGNAIDLVMHVFKNHGCCQYACRKCFYRASASQLVRAHMLRMHGAEVAKEAVLMTDIMTPVVDDRSELLTRVVAVQYYICQDMETSCKFKTFTQGKFCEHLMKHQPPYLCSECMVGFLTPTELTNHLKSHGLKLYQCTWCIHGADNETELLAHASEKHPTKQPQAYLRIITTKEGTSKMMVLPLAQLNKSNVRVQSVTLSGATDNPLRDAERSIELERLIGSMPRTLELFDTTHPENASLVVQPPESTSNDDGVLLEETERVTTPTPLKTDLQENLSSQIPPVLKTELLDERPVKETANNDVICLDSDEEDSRDSGPGSGVIAVSDDEASSKDINSKAQKIDHRLLYKCSKCLSVYKTKPAFKRHIHSMSCFPNSSEKIKCAHCPFLANTRDELYTHYDAHDARVNVHRFVCSMCDFSDKLGYVKNHMLTCHSVKNVVVSTKIDDTGVFLYTVSPKPGPKRKLSASKVEIPPKKKRYGPLEVDQLPTKPILDELVYCSLCEFNTKVRLNMVRHLQQHAEQQPVAQTVPVNPVPHLESNEKHFDKMVNLASSSIVSRAPDKPARVDSNPTVNLVIPPEAATRYPKYVPERQRYTCGAKGCSYTSLNEGMLKCHWEALHTGTIDFHCVHCPPYQHLDTSKPLTASRIIAHLKMHDVRLYACSSCTYYHYKSQVLDKHLAEVHNGAGQVTVVREEAALQPPAISQPTTAAPTMDLKAWQCGLCKFKSMLRQEVIEHCAKVHSTKMQFKCPNCPFRGSNLENVTKHQHNSHPGSTEETFYFYYREGTIPDQVDGTPRWLVQRQKMAIPDSEVKTEIPDNTAQTPAPLPVVQVPPPPVLDLNIVKKEVVEHVDEPIEQLCLRFGEFGEPNGLKYKCPLCKVVIEDDKDTMQSHLYEELKYRKWGCSICSYKAFHITGLNDHMSIEHSIRQNQTPVELPPDIRVEKWVTKLLEHQTNAMENNRENLAKQRIQVEKPSGSKTVHTEDAAVEAKDSDKPRTKELEEAFGHFGEAKNDQFCCPKCEFQNKDESLMRDHLESELNQIRWRCSNCSDNYQNYHEAQLHCKSVHAGLAARPIDAARDPALRAAWLNALLNAQRQSIYIETDASMQDDPSGLTSLENSLLVVRYEERIPTPEAEMLIRRKRPAPVASTSNAADSDDERLVIDEPTDDTALDKLEPKKKFEGKSCPHCDYSSKYTQCLQDHLLRHYDLKPFRCNHCNFTCYKKTRKNHHDTLHYGKPFSFSKTKVPAGLPVKMNLIQKGRRSKDDTEEINKEEPKVKDEGPKEICLVCERAMSEAEARTHTHDNILVQFGKKGDVVVKCCICFALLRNVTSMMDHHTAYHPAQTINYAFFKLHYDSREIHHCGHCGKRFKFLRDLKSHHNAMHSSLKLTYTTKPHLPGGDDSECAEERATEKRKTEDSSICPPAKKIAKKSTTKLPSHIVAKKSTTKLPNDDSDSEIEEYSYYGKKSPNLGEQSNVTTLMPVDAETLGERISPTLNK